jgi:hypothetical protein
VNEKGQPVEESPTEGQANLYGYGCELVAGETKCQTKFVGRAAVEGISAGFVEAGKSEDKGRPAQITPDGRDLVFSSDEPLAGELNKSPGTHFTGESVYRYDFQTRELTWVSHGAPGFKKVEDERQAIKVEGEGQEKYKGEGESSLVPPVPGGLLGADANVNDFNRAISGCPTKGERSEGEELEFSCPEGKYDGEYIIFVTPEKLQTNDENHAPDVYEWHCHPQPNGEPCPNPSTEGEVHLISDGRDPLGIALREHLGGSTEGNLGADFCCDTVGMSASGTNIFFSTHVPLVKQDTDVLGDVYDARIGGGFPAPTEPTCSGEACQGSPSLQPSFGAAASSTSPAAGNLVPPSITVAPLTQPKPKELTRAQKLAKALKACKGKPRKKRAVCESQARKRYGVKGKPGKTHRGKSTHRRGK